MSETQMESPTFEWHNNRKLAEMRTRNFRTDSDGLPNEWSPWQALTITGGTEFESFVDSLEGEAVTIERGLEELLEVTSDTVAGAVATVRLGEHHQRALEIEYRLRSVYPGLYPNVESLKAWVNARLETVDGERAEELADVAQALAMILVHDQGERDRQMPEGTCRHGRYVGGMGIDWMCTACESGDE